MRATAKAEARTWWGRSSPFQLVLLEWALRSPMATRLNSCEVSRNRRAISASCARFSAKASRTISSLAVWNSERAGRMYSGNMCESLGPNSVTFSSCPRTRKNRKSSRHVTHNTRHTTAQEGVAYDFGECAQGGDFDERVLVREEGHHVGHEPLQPALVVHVGYQLDKDVEGQQPRMLQRWPVQVEHRKEQWECQRAVLYASKVG